MMRKKPYYGWIIVLGCSLMLFYSIGFGINCFSIFIAPLIEKINISKTQASSIATLQNIGSLISLILSGEIINRYGARNVAFVSGLLMSLGYAIFATANCLAMCCMASFVVGLGFGSGSMVPVSIIIVEWFEDKRGLALGIATAGSGISTVIYPPLIASIIEKQGLSAGFFFSSINIVVIATISYIIIRNKPSDKNMQAFRNQTELQIINKSNLDNNTVHKNEEKGMLIGEAIKHKQFYVALLSLGIIGLTVQPTIAHISAVLTSEGYEPIFGAMMVSIYGTVMIFSKPLYGLVIDSFGVYKSNIYIYFLWTTCLISILFIGNGIIVPIIFAIALGLGAPIATIGIPMWTESMFGKKDFTKIYPVYKVAFTIGGTVGLSMPGAVADRIGSYIPVFIIYLIFTVISYILIQSCFGKNRV